MSYRQREFCGDVAWQSDASAAVAASSPSECRRSPREVAREMARLRSINAHLIRQIAVLKQREADAQRLADRDGLTGLFNRRCMLELLDASISDAAQFGRGVGLLFIDLDGFKGINDDHGHATGDKLLVSVASRIASRARSGDFVCRYGGDEFVVILPLVSETAAVRQAADSIAERVALPYRIEGVELKLTAAIGVSVYPDEARGAAALLRNADEAMYRSKYNAARSQRPRHPAAAPARRCDD